MHLMADILLYVDRNHCKLKLKLPVYSLSLTIFRDTVIYHPNIRDRLRNLLLQCIIKERNGELIDRDMVRALLNMYKDVSIDGNVQIKRNAFVYEEEFEDLFLSSTREFYRSESMNYLAQVIISIFCSLLAKLNLLLLLEIIS